MASLSFRLPDDVVAPYETRKVPWGFGILSEMTFLRTYSRKKPDGSKEDWTEVCRRVIEGMYSIQRDWCMEHRLPWSDAKAVRSASEAFDRLWSMKWTPPGRGLWVMGTEFVHDRHNSAALQNCSYVSTDEDLFEAMAFLMEASMLGVGVGFDVDAAGQYVVQGPVDRIESYVIPDTREGWVESTDRLLRYYLRKIDTAEDQYRAKPVLDYSRIRPAGSPIVGFGGTAAGPDPLIELHQTIERIFEDRAGQVITERDVADIGNLIGKCVVAGNVRRSAEILLGEPTQEFIDLKNPSVNPDRNDWETGWAHLSNNSIYATVGETDYEMIAERLVTNGEPGVFYLDLARSHGRLVDERNDRDYRVKGTNPCSEQSLESFECCTLVETYPTRHETLDDYCRTLKFAYLYAKSVTLLPTHWEKTNAIMQRNRRIGCSMTGIAQFVEQHTVTELWRWQDTGYRTIQDWDELYSEWLCVRPSIKTTSVKPSGTVSLLAGVTPGAHWPTYSTYIRRVRFAADDPIAAVAQEAGYRVEPDVTDPSGTVVVEFPVRLEGNVRTEHEVSAWEKVALVAGTQRWWADNQVSATVTFRKDEVDQVPAILRAHEGAIKSLSLKPIFDVGEEDVYAQLPYEAITDAEYQRAIAGIKDVDTSRLYRAGEEALGEKYCANDTCEIPT